MTTETIGLTGRNFTDEVLTSTQPVLIDFWAPWCGPCRVVGPAVSDLASEYTGRVKVGKVNVDEDSELASEYGITAIPSLLVFHKGRIINRIVGVVSKAALRTHLDEAISVSEGVTTV